MYTDTYTIHSSIHTITYCCALSLPLYQSVAQWYIQRIIQGATIHTVACEMRPQTERPKALQPLCSAAYAPAGTMLHWGLWSTLAWLALTWQQSLVVPAACTGPADYQRTVKDTSWFWGRSPSGRERSTQPLGSGLPEVSYIQRQYSSFYCCQGLY